MAKAPKPKEEEKADQSLVEEPAAVAKPEPALHQASRKGDADQVFMLLSQGHDPTVSVGVSCLPPSASWCERRLCLSFLIRAFVFACMSQMQCAFFFLFWSSCPHFKKLQSSSIFTMH